MRGAIAFDRVGRGRVRMIPAMRGRVRPPRWELDAWGEMELSLRLGEANFGSMKRNVPRCSPRMVDLYSWFDVYLVLARLDHVGGNCGGPQSGLRYGVLILHRDGAARS